MDLPQQLCMQWQHHRIAPMPYKMTRKRPVVRVTQLFAPSLQIDTASGPSQYKDLPVRRPFMLGDFGTAPLDVPIYLSCLLPHDATRRLGLLVAQP